MGLHFLNRPCDPPVSLCPSALGLITHSQLYRHSTPRASRRHRSPQRCCCSGAARHMEFHIGETSVAFPLDVTRAQELQQAMQQLLQTFAEKQKQERPKRYKSMEYSFKGVPDRNEVKHLELFCNPNASSNAFTAKVLISLQTHDGVKFTTEGPLTNIKSDIDMFVESASKGQD